MTRLPVSALGVIVAALVWSGPAPASTTSTPPSKANWTRVGGIGLHMRRDALVRRFGRGTTFGEQCLYNLGGLGLVSVKFEHGRVATIGAQRGVIVLPDGVGAWPVNGVPYARFPPASVYYDDGREVSNRYRGYTRYPAEDGGIPNTWGKVVKRPDGSGVWVVVSVNGPNGEVEYITLTWLPPGYRTADLMRRYLS